MNFDKLHFFVCMLKWAKIVHYYPWPSWGSGRAIITVYIQPHKYTLKRTPFMF